MRYTRARYRRYRRGWPQLPVRSGDRKLRATRLPRAVASRLNVVVESPGAIGSILTSFFSEEVQKRSLYFKSGWEGTACEEADVTPPLTRDNGDSLTVVRIRRMVG